MQPKQCQDEPVNLPSLGRSKVTNNKQDVSDYTKCIFCQIEFHSNRLKPQNVYLIFRYNIYLLILISKKNFVQTSINKNNNKLYQHTVQQQDDVNVTFSANFRLKKLSGGKMVTSYETYHVWSGNMIK